MRLADRLSLRLVSGNVSHLLQTASAFRYRYGETAALVVESPPRAANTPHGQPNLHRAHKHPDKHKYSTHKGSHKHSGMHTLICIATHTQFPLLMKRRAWFPLVVGALSTRPAVNRNSSLSTGLRSNLLLRPFSSKPVRRTEVLESSRLPGKLLNWPSSRIN